MDAGAPSRHPGFVQQQDVVSNLFGSAHWIVSPRSTNAQDSSSWPIPTSPRDICSVSRVWTGGIAPVLPKDQGCYVFPKEVCGFSQADSQAFTLTCLFVLLSLSFSEHTSLIWNTPRGGFLENKLELPITPSAHLPYKPGAEFLGPLSLAPSTCLGRFLNFQTRVKQVSPKTAPTYVAGISF